MADAARALISKIITEGDIAPALSAGIKADWFEDDEHRRVFAWMTEFYSRYQKSPTEHALSLEFPTYRVVTTSEPMAYYLDSFRHKRRFALMQDGVIDANEALQDDDVSAAADIFSQTLYDIGTEVSSLSDHDAIGKWRERYAEYDELRKLEWELTGIPTGFPTYDVMTGGFHDEQFILFAGASKQCKSWMLMKSAIAAQDFGKKVLFITFEMSLREQMARYDAMTCGLNSNKVLQRILTDDDMNKLKSGMRLRKNLPPFVVSADITATTTPSGLLGKIEEYQPDIVYVDGVYLMENESGAAPLTPQAYTSLSRSLKRLAQRIKKPIVGTMQALSGKMDKTGRVTLHSLGWSSSWSQDADLVFGVERDEAGPIVHLRIVGGRNVSPQVVGVHCNWEESIFDEYDEKEPEEDPSPKRRGSRGGVVHLYRDDGP